MGWSASIFREVGSCMVGFVADALKNRMTPGVKLDFIMIRFFLETATISPLSFFIVRLKDFVSLTDDGFFTDFSFSVVFWRQAP